MDGYNQQPQPQNQQLAPQNTPQGGGAYPDDYYYQGDTFRGMAPTDQAAQVRQAIFSLVLPEDDADFEEYIPMLITVVDMVARIPGVSTTVVHELNRRMEDIVDRAHSQGRRRIVASKMQKLVFRLRSYVPDGSAPIIGMTGIAAMITTNQNVKQEVRMPQQQTPVGGFWPWSRK